MSVIALQASGIKKSYAKDGRPLEILDVERFTAREGEFITIIGPSGCGKSTFLHIMGGFIPAEAGRIEVYGKEVKGPGPDRGMMFQEFSLFPWKSVAGNIAWGLEVQGVKGAVWNDDHPLVFREHLPHRGDEAGVKLAGRFVP